MNILENIKAELNAIFEELKNLMRTISKQFIWKPYQLFYVLIISFVCFFIRSHIVNFFDKLMVDKFLDRIYRDDLTIIEVTLALILFSIISYYACNKLIKNTYKVSPVTLYVPILASYFYWSERFVEKKYILATLIVKPFEIYQTDLFFCIITVISGILIFNLFRKIKIKKRRGILKQEIPLKDFSEDEFNREAYVKQLIYEITSLDLVHERSFTIGINSSWGNGKTSILHAIKKEISKNKSQICIEYDPWLSSHQDNLTYDFFVLLENRISQYLETSNLIIEYGEKLADSDHDNNPLKAIKHLFRTNRSLTETFDKISNLIRTLHRKIFVIIDDVDRLNNDEVMQILQLVRNTANFPNIIFIIAYDKSYLINALEVNEIYNPEKYLEKIIDIEVVLPVIESIKIKESLRKTIKEGLAHAMLTRQEIQFYEDQLSELIFSNSATLSSNKTKATSDNILEIVKNKRDIIKFSNSLILSLKLNKGRVYLPDLFTLELIKLRSTSTYEILARNDKYLVFETTDDKKKYSLFVSDATVNDPVENAFRGDFFNILTHTQVDKDVKPLINVLFESSSKQDYQVDKSIVISDNFQAYFLFADPSTNFDRQTVEDLIFT